MKVPLSDQLKDIPEHDKKLINDVFASLPDSVKVFYKDVFSSQNPIDTILANVPPHLRDTVKNFIGNGTADKALELMKQCRFFDARDMIETAISTFVFDDCYKSPSEALNKAAEFVTVRARALLYELLGRVEWTLGNTEKAGQCHREALSLAEACGDLNTRVKSLQGLGSYYFNLGNYDLGLQHCEEALSMIEGQIDHWRTRKTILTSLAVLYSEIGRYDDAGEYAMQAVEACTGAGDAQALPMCLNNLACICHEVGPGEKVVDLLQEALAMCEESGSIQNKALISCNLASCFIDFAEFESASALLDDACAISCQTGSVIDQAHAWNYRGLLYKLSGRGADAGDAFREAVALYRRAGAKAGESLALFNTAMYEKEFHGNIVLAAEACAQAIDIIEGIRGQLKQETYRISYTEQIVEPYAFIIDCYIKLKQPEKVLEYVERAKSRALLELLAGQVNSIPPGKSDPETCRKALDLLHSIEEIRKNLEAVYKSQDIEDNEDFDEPARKGFESLTLYLSEELREKQKTLDETYERLKKVNAGAASIVKVAPSSLQEISSSIDEGTFFLELYQTESCLNLILVSSAGEVKVATVDLPGEDAAGIVLNLSTAIRDQSCCDMRSHDFIRRIRQPLTDFYERLTAPFQDIFSSGKRLIISPHLFWHYFPFHILYDRKNKQYICDKIETGYCPSGSVLSLCRHKNLSGRKHALIMARNDGTLPFAEKEADMLAGCFYPYARTYKQNEAHLGRIDGEAGFDILHLACHGDFNAQQPLLSGIDIPPDASEEHRTYLLDLFQFNFPCSLVTLSACESGLSDFTSADELIGLSRGLFYAGAASVMLSLWQVADASTCLLMEKFYWHYAKNQQTKTKALQLAMQAVRNDEKYRHPYYWAPFVVMGDWR